MNPFRLEPPCRTTVYFIPRTCVLLDCSWKDPPQTGACGCPWRQCQGVWGSRMGRECDFSLTTLWYLELFYRKGKLSELIVGATLEVWLAQAGSQKWGQQHRAPPWSSPRVLCFHFHPDEARQDPRQALSHHPASPRPGLQDAGGQGAPLI